MRVPTVYGSVLVRLLQGCCRYSACLRTTMNLRRVFWWSAVEGLLAKVRRGVQNALLRLDDHANDELRTRCMMRGSVE